MPARPAGVADAATYARNFQTRRPHIQGILLCMFARDALRIWGSYFSFFLFSVYQKTTPPPKGGVGGNGAGRCRLFSLRRHRPGCVPLSHLYAILVP